MNYRLFFIVLFIVISFFSKELFFFDEEFVVVLSFFIVFFSLFNVLRGMVYNELESRSNQIFEQFEKMFLVKRELIKYLSVYYKKRNKLLLNKFLIFLNNIIFLVNKMVKDKVISLSYNISRILVSSLGNVILLENQFLKNQMLLSIDNVDKNLFFEICNEFLEISLNNVSKNIDKDYQKFF